MLWQGIQKDNNCNFKQNIPINNSEHFGENLRWRDQNAGILVKLTMDVE